MLKPTRREFKGRILEEWPGATVIEADRGMYVVVGSADVAMAIELKAKAAGYRPTGIDERGPQDFLVRIFGFPRGVDD